MPYQSTWINPYVQQQYAQYQPGQYQPTQYQQPQYQQPQYQQAQYQQAQYQQSQSYQQGQQPVNGIVKVNGRDSALQYQLPPNSTSIPLIDSSFDGKNGVFYVVSTDGTGTKSIEAYDFTPHAEMQPIEIDGAQFVSRDEFDDFARKVNAVIGAFDGSHGPVREPAADAPAVSQPSASPVNIIDQEGQHVSPITVDTQACAGIDGITSGVYAECMLDGTVYNVLASGHTLQFGIWDGEPDPTTTPVALISPAGPDGYAIVAIDREVLGLGSHVIRIYHKGANVTFEQPFIDALKAALYN